MSLKFCSFASGSSGNCYMVKNDKTALLIDAGISGKRIFSGLEETGHALRKCTGSADNPRTCRSCQEHTDSNEEAPQCPGLCQ